MGRKYYNQIKVGVFIQEKRSSLNLTQEQVAMFLNVSKTAVSNWENGISMVDVKYLVPLSNLFCVTVDDIVFANKISSKNDYNHSTDLFNKMLGGELSERKLYNKLIQLYIQNKFEIVWLLREYVETKNDSIFEQIKKINKFGFVFCGDNPGSISKSYFENVLKLDWENTAFEDWIETSWAYSYGLDWNNLDEMSSLYVFSDIFFYGKRELLSNAVSCVEHKNHNRIFMLDFIFSNCSKNLFKKYISSFSEEYIDILLKNLSKIQKIRNDRLVNDIMVQILRERIDKI